METFYSDDILLFLCSSILVIWVLTEAIWVF